jgi:hypothetical protein
MRAALRRARSGYLLALHVIWLSAAGRTPTEMATVLFCSRSRVYRIVRLYHAKQLGFTVDGGWPMGRPRPYHRPDALDQALAGRPAQGPTPDVWVGSHALELCGVGARTPRPTSP